MKATFPALVGGLNFIIYAVQGVRLGLERGPLTPLVLSNMFISGLFLGAILIAIFYPRASLLTSYTVSVAIFVTYRMWDSALNPEQDLLFRAAHAFMIFLAWLLVSASITYSVRGRMKREATLKGAMQV